jgi:hydrogenase expression/formation protein HypE
MANEGRMLVICPAEQADTALSLLRQWQPEAALIGLVGEPLTEAPLLQRQQPVDLRNGLGVRRPLDVGRGEQLPRIC